MGSSKLYILLLWLNICCFRFKPFVPSKEYKRGNIKMCTFIQVAPKILPVNWHSVVIFFWFHPPLWLLCCYPFLCQYKRSQSEKAWHPTSVLPLENQLDYRFGGWNQNFLKELATQLSDWLHAHYFLPWHWEGWNGSPLPVFCLRIQYVKAWWNAVSGWHRAGQTKGDLKAAAAAATWSRKHKGWDYCGLHLYPWEVN